MRRFAYVKAAAVIAAAAALIIALLPPSGCPAAPARGEEGPAAPAGLRQLDRPEDAGKRIGLTWEADAGVIGYQVYRSGDPGGAYELVGGKSSDSMLDYPVFLDDTAKAGVAYYYRVTSLDDSWTEGPPCEPVGALLKPAFTAAAGAKSILISITDQKVFYYEGSQLVNILRCSTGARPGSTPTGNFRVLNHLRYNAGCDYWLSFTAGHGMHGWPRATPRYEEGLGAPASHGCVRLHPLEAYWPYAWAPDGTPIHITYASHARRVVNGCAGTIGSTGLSNDWYFAEGCTFDTFDTWLLLANPGDAGAEVRVEFLLEGDAAVSRDYFVAAHSRFTLPVDEVPGLQEVSCSMSVHSSRPIVAERAMYFIYDNSKSDGSVTTGATAPSGDWYFAEGCCAGDFDSYLLLSNPGDAGVTARLDFQLEGGATLRQEYPIAPRSRFSVPVDGIPGMEEAAFSAHVHASGPIVAERAMYFRKGLVEGGHVSMGAAQPSTRWYFAEGCTREFFESYLLIGNGGEQDATVDVDFFLGDGNVRHTFSVGAHSRVTVPIQELPFLDYQDAAFTLSSDCPVVAERAQYYSLDSRRGGQASIGSPEASATWYFAEGYTGESFDTWLLLSNPGGETASMIVSFAREDGAVLDYFFTVGPWRRVSVHVDELAGLEEAAFSIRVGADCPVVAERAMYFVIPRGY